MSTSLYLAGPMTGYPQFNFPAFFAAADDLRKRGINIVSPAELDDEDTASAAMASPDGDMATYGAAGKPTWGDFLARDVKIVADQVDGVVTLPNWWKSRGARLEVFVALSCHKPVFAYTPDQDDGLFPVDETLAMNLIQENL